MYNIYYKRKIMLRIVAGKFRHLQITQPDLKTTRPTMDKVREAIFSSIQFELPNAVFLDLFAGSGAFAIEAISREANSAVAVENNKETFSILRENVLKTKSNQLFDLHYKGALDYLKISKQKFDIVFIDPPYVEYELINQCLIELKQRNLLSENFTVIIETNDAKKIIFDDFYYLYKQKKYGKVEVLYLCKN
ncbi:16S rRNA (guanine(966)-N(2))-methyltransferase RsmD [Mycoplasma nasistruthionis]|uniref:16S rRNA (Guanine(966)-N(2))-methyltransferase RsmD n=2 Tax=Mycoplasma nasistruthionis TaxID=353852 RepID=A0A5B7XUP2_9MOLU|nr:16S rRNA (guanine(966)-N(2))-methyltransferase RsmD [Mycoplasma nasistruthionis]